VWYINSWKTERPGGARETEEEEEEEWRGLNRGGWVRVGELRARAGKSENRRVDVPLRSKFCWDLHNAA
jgi:hypothetical protein